ncbi:MAG: tryptophan--tRNA ligase [Campylobacterales bacterium]
MRVLSGIQPSGALHLGNYFGMMKPMIDLQGESELFCFIANYHAMTSLSDGEALRANVMEAAISFLSLGLDPYQSTFWVQSDVPEVLELYWVLSNFTPMGLLERAHSYKDKIAKGIHANHGLFSYPVLMAADILLFGGERVPVGKDQIQHLEMARDIAMKFNHHYGEIFTLPEAQIAEEVAVVPGIDGAKMSKSYGNTIEIFGYESQKALKKRISQIVTDSTPLEAPKDPDKCSIFALSKLFMNSDEIEALRARYLKGGEGYGHFKAELTERIWAYFEPYREKRAYYLAHPKEVYEILAEGARKARASAIPIIEKVREVTGIHYRRVS